MPNLSNNLTPVRYYTEADPYYYTVDNRPIDDLAVRDVELATEIDLINTAVGETDILSVVGTVNAIAVTTRGIADVHRVGVFYRFQSTGANTGPVTFEVNALAPMPVLDNFGNALVAGSIPHANYICLFQSTATGFSMVNPAAIREITQPYSGRIRTMTPLNGALMREWADVTEGTVASTTGAIEFGWTFNCDINQTNNNWLGRDITDACWLVKYSDVGGHHQVWYAPSAAAGTLPVWTKTYELDTSTGAISITGALKQNFSGLIRDMTPIGGARVREWADIIGGNVATTTGNIEIGTTFNVAIDPATSNWLGRDVADICWLEKWSDVGGVKEYWYAPTGGANTVPVWTKIFSVDTVNGMVNVPTMPAGTNNSSAASMAALKTAVNGLAPLNSPALAGTPTCPTAAQGTSTGQVASTAFVVNELINQFSAAGRGSFAGNGYQKLPGGLIIQWGSGAFPAMTWYGQGSGIAFPTTYPNACLNVVTSSGVAWAPISCTAWTKSTFTAQAYAYPYAYGYWYWNSGNGNYYRPYSYLYGTTVPFRWISIGY